MTNPIGSNFSLSAKLSVTQSLGALVAILVAEGKVVPTLSLSVESNDVKPALPKNGGVLVTPEGVALILGLSPKTLANWRVAGRGPQFLKVGSKIRYEAEAVRQWQVATRRSSTSEASHDYE